MGSSKKQTVGYKYYLGMHLILCHGPIDFVSAIKVDRRTAWSGKSTGGRINVSNEGLFGGEEREGGVSGAIDLEMGRSDQGRNDYLQSKLGTTSIPAFRKVVGLVLRQCYLGLNPYLKPWGFRGQRIHVRQDGLAQWYDAKAAVPNPKAAVITRTYTDFVNGFESNDPTKFQIIDGALANADNLPAVDNSSWYGTELGNFLPTKMYCEFQIISTGQGDPLAVALQIANPSLTNHTTSLNPRTELASDPLGRPNANYFSNSAGGQPVYGSALAAGVWYSYETELNYLSATQNYTLKLGETVLASGTLPIVAQAPRRLVFQRSHNLPGTVTVAAFRKVVLTGVEGTSDMNPAHIIRECLTDPDWGMGYSEADIDDVSFMYAADMLYAENMGISILWDRQTPIEDFINEIVKHIAASLYVDRTTGKFVLKLIRADYDVEDLLVLDESHIQKVEGATRPTAGELVNSVTAVYWDTNTGENGSVTVQDQALIQMQGAVINTTLQYPGFTNSDIASRAALRALTSLSVPLLSCTVYADRSASLLNIGDVFVMNWPDLDVNNLVMRVTAMALGDGKTNVVKLTVVEDVFAMPTSSTVVVDNPPPTGDVDPSAPAQPAQLRAAVEMPYYEAVQQFGQATVDSTLAGGPDAGYVMAGCARPAAELHAVMQTDPGTGFEDVGVFDFCPGATLAALAGRLDTVLSIEDGVDLDLLVAGSWAAAVTPLGKVEFLRVDSVDTVAGTMTVGRAVHDTIPLELPPLTRIVMLDYDNGADPTEYASGETINVRLLPTSGSGRVPDASALVDTVTMAGRAFRPYPPADFKVNAAYWPDELGSATSIDVTWVHRDRVQQTGGTLLDFQDPSVGPEAGVTYTVQAYGIDSLGAETLFVDHAGLIGTSHSIDLTVDVPPTDAVLVSVRLFSVRDGRQSLFQHRCDLNILTAPYDLDAVYTA